MKRAVYILSILMLLASCKEYGPGGGGKIETGNLTGINKWTYEQMWDWYYWQDEMRSTSIPAGGLSYNTFLSNLIMGMGDVRDADGTMDGGYDEFGKRKIYSSITRTSAEQWTRGVSYETGFGFDFEVFYRTKGATMQTSTFCFLVTWVQPGGPACQAGLRRGMWIMEYNGVAPINYNAYAGFWNKVYHLMGGTQLSVRVMESLKDTNGTDVVFSAETTSIDPIIYHNVVTSPGGRNVAYLVYNRFEEGQGGEFDRKMRTVFGEFKSAGAEELVLDLRYNPGGNVECARLMASLAGNVDGGDVFVKLKFNPTIAKRYGWNPRMDRFYNESSSLKLNKVYILATKNSASASEMVINSLRGVLGDENVVHIGTITEGKNVGMNVFTKNIGGYSYELAPISFKIYNAKDFCDYAGGFEPTYYVNEFRNLYNFGDGSGIVRQLGDVQESLLGAALTLIDGGNVTPDPKTVSDEETRTARSNYEPQHLPRKKDDGRGGAKLYDLPM